MHKYKYINPNDLFEEEEEEDAEQYTFVNEAYTTSLEQNLRLEKQRKIERSTLKSSTQCLKIIADTENIAITTTEELARQGEALYNTNRYMEEISTNLKYSQRDINGIQSILYEVKDRISGKYKQRFSCTQDAFSPRSNMFVATSSSYTETLEKSGPISAGGVNEQSMLTARTTKDPVSQILDKNLDEIAHGIEKLKYIGMSLGKEIDRQNDLIDVIRDKVEGADIKICRQTLQMKKLQKK